MLYIKTESSTVNEDPLLFMTVKVCFLQQAVNFQYKIYLLQ